MKKVKLDRTRCVGCGSCVLACGFNEGGNFDFDNDGFAKVVNENVTENTINAVKGCPFLAISIEDDEENNKEKEEEK